MVAEERVVGLAEAVRAGEETVKVRAVRLWETAKPRNLEAMGWALAW